MPQCSCGRYVAETADGRCYGCRVSKQLSAPEVRARLRREQAQETAASAYPRDRSSPKRNLAG